MSENTAMQGRAKQSWWITMLRHLPTRLRFLIILARTVNAQLQTFQVKLAGQKKKMHGNHMHSLYMCVLRWSCLVDIHLLHSSEKLPSFRAATQTTHSTWVHLVTSKATPGRSPSLCRDFSYFNMSSCGRHTLFFHFADPVSIMDYHYYKNDQPVV